MADIPAHQVKELRERTGAGMLDCRTALRESGGDLEQAVDVLRKKGLAKAATKAGRIAAEGLIGLRADGGKGVLVEVNSETDFVARNELFQGLVRLIAQVALTVGSDLDNIKAAKVGNIRIGEAINDTIAKIGENITLRRASSLAAAQGVIGSYMHNSVDEGLGKIGVIVALESGGAADELGKFGHLLAMQVAAANPQAIDPAGLDPDLVRREREILSERATAQGKPAHVVEKIIESGLRSFYKEVCLIEQPFIHDPSKSVADAIKEVEGKLKSSIKVTGFVRYVLGEGIHRPDTDFAAEVAATAARE